MTQEELKQFLKDNLRIEVSTSFDVYDDTKSIRIYTSDDVY